MIFVTVGTARGFPRLIMKMDEIADKIEENVIMQIGYTKYKPRNAEYFDFVPYKQIQQLCQQARVIVCHGGVGSVITALRTRTPAIAVPELRKYGEFRDDHQLDTVRALAKEGVIQAVYEINELEKALENIPQHLPKVTEQRSSLAMGLKRYISDLDKSLKSKRHRS